MSLVLTSALLSLLQGQLPEEQVGGEIVSRFLLEGESAHARFGAAVVSGADFDGDQIDDIVVSADLADPGGLINAGSVFIYSGADGTLILRIDGIVDDIQLGSAIAISEDMNGDSIPDLVVGAIGVNTPSGFDRGSVFVFSGANGSAIHRVDGTQDLGALGGAVAALGDVDGDTVPDFAAGAQWFDDSGFSNSGRVEVYSGVNGALLWAIDGSHTNNFVGSALAVAEDANGDSIPDLLVGDRGRNVGTKLRAGGATLRSGADGTLIFDFPGQDAFDLCGAALASVGDMNADGVRDFAISSHNASPSNRNNAGRVRVFSGSDGLFIFPIIGQVPQAWLGYSVADAGDVNGDGYGDLLIGATVEDPLLLDDAGSAYVFSGRDRGLMFRVNGLENDANMGFSGAGLGDFDGDGNSEIAVAAAGATVDDGSGPMPGAGSVDLINLNPFLRLSAHEFSQSAGGTIDMTVDFPLSEANGDYALLFTALPPGMNQFNGFPLPLQFDTFTAGAAVGQYPPIFVNPRGGLDANGDAAIQLSVGAGQITPAAIGSTFLACVVSADIILGMPLLSTIAQPMRLDP